MSDNGFGNKANSPDFELRVHRIVADPGSGVTTVADGGFGLSDPDRLIPWTIWRDGGCAAAPALPAGYTCPAPDRVLTGWDFDIESFQVAPDGTFWFGDEFGPFLLHTDATGRLLAAPIPTPGVASPSNPTLSPGGVPNLANSKGYEGLAISPDGRTLYPLLEGPIAEDVAAGLAADLRIFEVKRRPPGPGPVHGRPLALPDGAPGQRHRRLHRRQRRPVPRHRAGQRSRPDRPVQGRVPGRSAGPRPRRLRGQGPAGEPDGGAGPRRGGRLRRLLHRSPS